MELIKNEVMQNVKMKNSLSLFLAKYRTTLILSVISFLISRLSVAGELSPFSLTMTFVCNGNLFVALFGTLGILSNSEINSYQHVLTMIFGLSIFRFLKFTFPELPIKKAAPVLLFCSSFLFGMIFVIFRDFVVYDVLLVLFESFLATVFYYILGKGLDMVTDLSKKKFFTTEQTAAALVVLTMMIAGIGTPTLPLDLSIKNVICILAVLIAAMFSNFGVTAQVSAFMGIAAGLSTDDLGIYVAIYAVNGLIASVFSKYGKLAAVLGFVVSNVAMSILLAYPRYMAVGFVEIALSAIIFALIPESFLTKLFSSAMQKSGDYDKAYVIKSIATVKLDRLSLAFRKLSDTIHTAVNKTSRTNLNNIGTLFDAVADKVCKRCAMRFYCWQKEYDSTMEAMMRIAKSIEQTGTATVDDFPDFFHKKCVKSNEILTALMNLYEIYRLNTVWQNKMKENTKIYREQFLELSDIVLNLREEIDKNPYFDRNMSTEISALLEKEGISVKSVNVIKDCNDNTEIEMILFACQQKDRCYQLIQEILEELIGVPFYRFSGKCSARECHLVFRESELYQLSCSAKQSTKPNSEQSGDVYSVKTMENSSQYIALCDGSGSGSNAHHYSASTLRLLEEFLKTGFSKTTSIKLINSSLLTNGEQDYFSTIDLSIVDLKNGELEVIKKGAAPTYIMRAGGSFEVLRSNNLPVGVPGSEKNAIRKTTLSENDIIVMVSDGIADCIDKEDWIIDALKAINSDDPEQLSDLILKIAQSTDHQDQDDMTVIVSKVLKNV